MSTVFDADGALSREFLLQRGYCCGNGCRNCPYGFHDRESPEPSARLPQPRSRVPEPRE